jgi:uncharacterized protein YidB (DUF937 family)
MGLFDDIKGALFQTAEGEAQGLIGGAVEKAVPGGLDGLLSKLQQGGLGEEVRSWVGDGHNIPVSPDQIQGALGDEHVQQIAQHMGLDPTQVLQGLSEHLPSLAAKNATN